MQKIKPAISMPFVFEFHGMYAFGIQKSQYKL